MTAIYKWLAGAIAILAVVGIIYGKGRIDSDHASEISNLKVDLMTAQVSIDAEKAARRADTELARKANDRLNQLNLTIDGLNAYADALQDADNECLSSTDNDRLRQLWGR